MSSYTFAYSCPASNVSTAVLSTKFAALPRDTNTETTLGLQPVSDVMSTAGNMVTRTITVQPAPSSGGNPVPQPLGNPGTSAALTNMYTESFSRGLTSRVQASAVVYTP